MTFNVFVASRSFGPNCPEAIHRLKAAGANLIENPWGRSPNETELASAMHDVDVLVSGTEPVTARVMDAAPNLMFIAKHGVGYENIDLEAAKARGVPVAIAGGAIADSVADMAMALLLALARHVPQGDRAVRDGKWPRLVGAELREKTLGIIGLGQIGREVALRAKAFGMELIAFDVQPNEAFAKEQGIHFMPMLDVLMQADFVTLHTPVTEKTRGLINAVTLQSMKRSAYLINTARGELIDEAALEMGLREGWIAGAACDVFAKEPPGDNPLLKLDNFIAAPHSAGQTDAGLRKLGEVTVDNIIRLMHGEELLHRIA
jgi:D-3-phosphoglycerate dehydrogenase